MRPLNVGILPNLLGYNVRRAHMALWRDFNRTVGTGIVRPGIFSMLVLIDENPGIAQIERRPSRADRRRQDLFLTAQGRPELATLRREMLLHEARFTNLFSRQELTQFFDFLRRIQI
jgi:hypothetical protein